MPSVDIIDWSNTKVGSVDLSDTVFGAKVNEAHACMKRCVIIRPASARHGVDPDAA